MNNFFGIITVFNASIYSLRHNENGLELKNVYPLFDEKNYKN